MFDRNIFRQRFSMLRNIKNLSLNQLAQKFDLSKGTIGHWETGQRIPSLEAAVEAADFFHVDLDYLVGRTPLYQHPEQVLDYDFLDRKGKLRCVFGVFPLKHMTSQFLYIEELEGDFLEKLIADKNHLHFIALIWFLNDRLNLGYRLDPESVTKIHRINLIIKDQENQIPLQRYKEIKSATGAPVVITDFFTGYEEFVRDYLKKPTDEKISFLKWYLAGYFLT